MFKAAWCFVFHRLLPMQVPGVRLYDFVGPHTCRCRVCGHEFDNGIHR